MGYTHYWKLNKELNESVLKDVQLIVNKHSHLIQFESHINKEPIVSKKEIRFNGIDEDGHETFFVEFNDSNFCKTASKPYDLPVCEVLLVLKHHYKDDFELDSDGFWVSKDDLLKNEFDGDWRQALDNVRKEFGYEFEIYNEISNSGGYTYYKLGVR